MRGLVEAAAFVALAGAVHAAILAGIGPDHDGGASGAGADGAAPLSLAAMDAGLQAAVARQLAPPSVAPVARLPEPAPEGEPSPVQPATTAAPVRRPAPDALSAPRHEHAPLLSDGAFAPLVGSAPALPVPEAGTSQEARPLAPSLAPRPPVVPAPPAAPRAAALQPPPRPDAPPEAVPAAPPAKAAPRSGSDTPRAAQVARGEGGQTAAGQAGSARAAQDEARRASLMARWGAGLRARVDRRKSYPAAAGRAAGTAVVALEVHRSGRLVAASLARSSGNAALDSAALDAVRRAGPFPQAPRELEGTSFRFNLPVDFRR